jgi:hypothetical protein
LYVDGVFYGVKNVPYSVHVINKEEITTIYFY